MAKQKTEYVKCPKCGNEMPKGSAFCSACGSKIEEPKIEFVTCKHCGNQTPALSIFCMHCGAEMKKKKKSRVKKEAYIPEPKELPSGKWFIHLRIDGQQIPITRDTYAECKAEASAIKNGIKQAKPKKESCTLKQACRKYIDDRSNILSPSSVTGYEDILRNRFKKYMNQSIYEINYQKMIDDETCCAKTTKSAWIFARCAIKSVDEEAVPKKLLLPQIVKKELPWLTSEQIPILLDAIKGDPCEIGIILGLHGLRKSEILAVTPKKIHDGSIYVEGSRVIDKNGKIVAKETNKNMNSRRQVPILIPRLNEILQNGNFKEDEPLTKPYNALYKYIVRICKEKNLPNIGVHGLRRSFVSLCYSQGISERVCMAWGGWSNIITMHDRYIKLSQTDNDEAVRQIQSFYEKKANNANENANENAEP